jgi:two-component system, chemotaxis family, CheB/CheR fusion protein
MHNVLAQRRRWLGPLCRSSGYRQLCNKSTTTVIVVDDDASIRRALRRQLQILGFSVLDFQSAEEFLASEFPTGEACLLLDVYMPGMTGIELCRKMAATGRRLPTILLSGRDDEQTRQMMRKANPVASLFKPFDEKKLLSAIHKALGSGANSPR